MSEQRVNWTTDEVVLVAAAVARNDWRGFSAESSQAIHLSRLLRSAPFHPEEVRGEKFRNRNGVARKSFDLATLHPDYRGKPTKGGKVDRVVLRDFLDDPTRMMSIASHIESAIQRADFDHRSLSLHIELDAEDDLFSAPEGRLLYAIRRRYERDPKLRRAKLARVMKSSGSLRCEVCAFDFAEVYGERGSGYAEVHHTVPLHVSGPTTNSLDDLAVLCSNCHRMIHRGNRWISITELREIVDRQRLND